MQFERTLDDEVADWLAKDLAERPVAGSTIDDDIADLTAALESDLSLTEGSIPQPHSNEAVRKFLTRVVSLMNEQNL
ncbi:hypothetical protein [Nocardia sp. NPDC057440]|uniref:hypothetical protein n=1 Tax=Nocardia sp. NPDC057440 TaxID=3346134 RepID=UPI00366C49BB